MATTNQTEESKVKCPECGSFQIHADQRGWSGLTGFIGSGKIVITCLVCGKRFLPGENLRPKRNPTAEGKGILIVLAVVYLVWAAMYGLSHLDAAISQWIRCNP